MAKLNIGATAAAAYAHLTGIRPRVEEGGGEDDDKKPEQKADESDDDYAKRMKAWRKAKGKAEDGSEDDETAEAPEDDDKKAAVAAAYAKGAADQLARCKAIIASPHSAKKVHVACYLAFDTSLPAAEAIGALAALKDDDTASGLPAARGSRGGALAAAMAVTPIANPGSGGGPDATAPDATVNAFLAAARKAGVLT